MTLNDEQKMIQQTASDIASQELMPRAAKVDKEQVFPMEGLKKLAEAGFLGLTVPATMGVGVPTLSPLFWLRKLSLEGVLQQLWYSLLMWLWPELWLSLATMNKRSGFCQH